MSSILEKAITDANLLKEMARKHAEKSVIEKFKPSIEDAVNFILEQADSGDDADDADDKDPMSDADNTHVVELNDKLSEEDDKGFAFMESGSEEGSKEEIELEFDTIVAEVKRMEEAGIYDMDEAYDDKEELEEEYEIDEELLSEMTPDNDEESDLLADLEAIEEEESVEITEEELAAAVKEAVTMDYKARKTGWLNSPDDLRGQEVLAQSLADEFQRHNEELEAKNRNLKADKKKLDKKVDSLQSKLLESTKRNENLVETIHKVKDQFNKVQLLNAKLHFINKTVMDASLNERQKNKIVESINDADSVEKAKMIYETLQAGVGTSSNRGPESLREAVSNHSSVTTLLKGKQKTNKVPEVESLAKRMKRLAGITDK